jgi:hypothetical protein
MSIERARRDVNRTTTLLAVTNDSNLDPSNLRVDPVTLRLLTTVTGTVVADNLGTSTKYGRATSSGSATSLGSTQTIKNGMIITALSTNSASVYLGDASVTTSTGYELQAGGAVSIAISDPSAVYVVGTGTVCWISSV